MWLSVSGLSMLNLVFYRYFERMEKDITFIETHFFKLLKILQHYSLLALLVVAIVLVAFYTGKLVLYFLQGRNNQVNRRLKRRVKMLDEVFENMKIPEEKYPKYDYERSDNFFILTIYKNFYLETKMVADNIAKFEQVFKLQATKINEEGFDKIQIYFVLEERILELEDVTTDLPAYEICLGQSLNELLTINLNLTPHLLIAGSNGSGKTSFMRFLYYQFKQKQDAGQTRIILFDGKGNEFADYSNDVEVIYQGFLTALAQIHEDMKHKYSELRTSGRRLLASDEHRVIVMIDEYTSILTNLSKDERKKFEELAGDLARLGRSAGFNLVIGLQRADANIIKGEIKENMTKVLLGSASDEAKRIMFARTDVINQPRGSGNVQIDDAMSVFKFPYVE
jgi:ABC-type cobalamin/Fe3+-siderophores transport system ATPase subunit